MATEFVTIKVTTDTRVMLRLLSAHSGKDIYDIAEMLAWDEMKRKKISPSEVLKEATKRRAMAEKATAQMRHAKAKNGGRK